MPKLVSITPNAASYDIEEALFAAPEFMAHLGIDKDWVHFNRIGSGAFALVYALPDESKVLKVTADAQDALVAKIIFDAGGVRGLVRVFDVVALPEDYLGFHPSGAKRHGGLKLWGLVVERVRPSHRSRGMRSDREVPSLMPMVKAALQGHVSYDDEARARLLASFRKAATSRSSGKADLAYGWLWLHDRGHDVGDLHDGNVGWSDARQQAVLIDFGFKSGPGPEVRTVKNPLTPNRATLEDIEAALLRAPNFLASLGMHSDDGRTLNFEQIGLGHYAHAFLLPNGLVLKVTDDEADARVCKLIFDTGSGKPGLPYIQSVHRLPGEVFYNDTDVNEKRPIFAIVMEAVSPASKTFHGLGPRRLGESVLYPSMDPDLPNDEAREFVRQIRKGIHWLAKHGVSVIDLHHNNFGYASGKRPVIIDFGHESLREDFKMTPLDVARNPGAAYGYHATSHEALPRIAAEGLVPRNEAGERNEDRAHDEPAVFFSLTRDQAAVWGPTVLRFPLSALPEYHDDDYGDTILLDDGSVGRTNYWTPDAIPADVLEYPVGGKDKWRKLVDRYSSLEKNSRRSKIHTAFDECFDVLTHKFPDFGDLELHQDERAGSDNGHGSERQFGYCKDGKPISIAFAAKTEELSVANIRGLMAHEFGHALDYRYGDKLGKMIGKRLPDGVERRADAIAQAVFGWTIKYDSKDVQCVACQGTSPRPRRLGP